MQPKEQSRFAVRDLAYIALSAAVVAVCAWITVPTVVPFTMQTFAIFVAGGLLGARRATAAQLIYTLLGLVGLPVFAGFRSGAGTLLGTTGGYIIGFVFTALLTGLFAQRSKGRWWIQIMGMVAGLAVCYAFGTAWYVIMYTHHTGPIGVMSVLWTCVIPFMLPDALKIALALLVVRRTSQYVQL